ncbi:hypothetical protein [Nocardia mangyaensis]|uniref:hypothetical protein n=1 Tax=Nocardia mangyaensis TaxID=2213200 RepID=UPI002675D025|nr:hypothetical protein [Nocardia mangyaensis]MDO3648170.1 hypothetical protein [Nocardia mangyaensis]
MKWTATGIAAAATAIAVMSAPAAASPWTVGMGPGPNARGELSFIALCNSVASFTKHGRQQAISRGISEDMMDQAIAKANRTGKRYKRQGADTIKYVGDKVWVVLNSKCAVVSTGWN